MRPLTIHLPAGVKPYYCDDDVCILLGDCQEIVPTLGRFSACITDPPYGLRFMGKAWDYDVPGVDLWRVIFEALKPGAHLLAFAGTRTQHRMAVNIEDAGFEIRDMIAWVYGSGFPKSLDVSKAIDRMDASDEQARRRFQFTAWVRSTGATSRQIDDATGTKMGNHYTTHPSQPAIMTREHLEACRAFLGDVPAWVERECDIRTVESRNMAEREVVGVAEMRDTAEVRIAVTASADDYDAAARRVVPITAPATDAARQWAGWGTALKPSHEPVGVYYKPLTMETVCAILLADATEQIWSKLCQRSNVSASDAESLLSGIRARLEKAAALTVAAHVRISVLEKPENAILAARSSTSPERTETERDTIRADSVLASANPNGKASDTPETETQAGQAGGMNTVDTFISAMMDGTSENIALCWSGTLAAVLDQASTFTTRTALRLTTELKTLKSLMQASILQDTGNANNYSPAMEPITVARKPLIGTVAENVLAWGTGAINIDACRVDSPVLDSELRTSSRGASEFFGLGVKQEGERHNPAGRWPANLIHDGSDEVVGMFPDVHGAGRARKASEGTHRGWHDGATNFRGAPAMRFGDSGSAARFFYCAKASKAERDEGCEGLELKPCGTMEDDNYDIKTGSGNSRDTQRRNHHPTVKPVKLMQYLITLGLPPGGVLLDPFAGSGTTAVAAKSLGRKCVCVEREERYCEIAAKRCSQQYLSLT